MIDSEVTRLRKLRDTALRARAMAAALESPARCNSVFSRSALSCWRIARTVTGRLRAHPHLNYQRGPGGVRGAYDRVNATWLSGIARYRGSSLQSFSRELGRVLRELDDVRALTWSADLSDSLGRFQTQIRRLIEEVDAGARQETGGHCEPAVSLEARGCTVRPSAASAGNWPYLGF